MPKRSLVLPILLCVSFMYAEDPADHSSAFRFLPGRTIFPNIPASYEEPRLGLTKDINTSHMKLDIGSSMEVLNVSVSHDSTQNLRFGADFFAYALVTSYEGLRLQVDALDGYFGGHAVYRVQLPHSALLLRFRFLHLSSHLLDGHFNLSDSTWRGGRFPNPLSRDYGEITAGHLWQWDSSELFLYAGFSHATFIRPPTMKRLNAVFGVAAHTGDWTGFLAGRPVHFYASDHFRLWGVDTFSGTNMFEAGVKFGEWNGAGIRIFLSHHSGLEVYHQYFDMKSDDWGLGFALEP
jgi:hypothetical protein